MTQETLSIIIVNWNAGKQLRDCITSIGHVKQDSYTLTEVIVVDNGSTDDSLNGIDVPGVQIKLIANKKNIGFAAGCNQGADIAKGEYFLFLNPDTRLFDDSLEVPMLFIRHPENSTVGIVGIQLLDENGNVARSCSRFPSLKFFVAQAFGINRIPMFRHLTQSMEEWAHDHTRGVDQVIGAFFLIRRTTFELLGGFDERFFVYYEEVDMSFRAHQIGLRSVYMTEAKAFHAGCGTSRQIKTKRLFYSLRSRLLYGLKHFRPLQVVLLMLITLTVEPITRVAFSLLKGSFKDAWHTLGAYKMLIFDFYNIIENSNKLKND